MELNIYITLSQQDIDDGITAQTAVEILFPAEPEAPVAVQLVPNTVVPITSLATSDEEEEDLDALMEAAELEAGITDHVEGTDPDEATVAAETAEHFDETAGHPEIDPDVVLDSARVPWTAGIHNGNQKFYSSGTQRGRWMWARGIDKVAAEAQAMLLVVPETAATAAAVETAAIHPAVGAVVGAIASPPGQAENAAATAATPPGQPENKVVPGPGAVGAAVAAAAVVPTRVDPTVVTAGADGLISWPQFLGNLKAAGLSANDVTPHLAQYELESIAHLARQHEIRQAIAVALNIV